MNFVTSGELFELGFTPCNDADLRTKVFDLYDSEKVILLNDKEEKPQLFVRHSDDVFSFYKSVGHAKPAEMEVVS
jgi:hypothetical protein